VPRSYIGELIATGRLDDLLESPPREVLDLCTGSGCLAILAALQFSEAQVDAVELSAGALEVARRNVGDYDLLERIDLLQGDLLTTVLGRRYDLVIANPPYVAAPEVAAFAPEYAAEPVMAHIGGDDGLDLVRRILDGVAAHLSPDGVLIMEVGTGREIIEAAYPHIPFTWLDTEASEGEVLMIGASEFTPAKRKSRGQS